VSAPALTYAAAARIMREAVRDKRYRAMPLGPMVVRYLRWFKNEWGASPESVRSYEAILARMCLTLGETRFEAVQTDDLREVIDVCWGDRSAGTRKNVTSVIRAFWSWSEEEGLIAVNPASRIRRPRGERKVPRVLPADARPRLLEVAKQPRDRLALLVLVCTGVRAGELGRIQVRDFDVLRGKLRVYGKGQKERVLPLPGPVLAELGLFLAADLPHLDRPPERDDYLLYPIRTLAAGKGSEGQLLRRRVAFPKDHPSGQYVWRWYKRLKADAGLPEEGGLHEARHLFAMEMRRVAGIDAASHALGHADLSTTLSAYGHWDDSDLESAMRLYGEYLEREARNVPPEGER
jgi:integrase/recombinase XerC